MTEFNSRESGADTQSIEPTQVLTSRGPSQWLTETGRLLTESHDMENLQVERALEQHITAAATPSSQDIEMLSTLLPLYPCRN